MRMPGPTRRSTKERPIYCAPCVRRRLPAPHEARRNGVRQYGQHIQRARVRFNYPNDSGLSAHPERCLVRRWRPIGLYNHWWLKLLTPPASSHAGAASACIMICPMPNSFPRSQRSDHHDHVATVQRATFDAGQNIFLNPCVERLESTDKQEGRCFRPFSIRATRRDRVRRLMLPALPEHPPPKLGRNARDRL